MYIANVCNRKIKSYNLLDDDPTMTVTDTGMGEGSGTLLHS